MDLFSSGLTEGLTVKTMPTATGSERAGRPVLRNAFFPKERGTSSLQRPSIEDLVYCKKLEYVTGGLHRICAAYNVE